MIKSLIKPKLIVDRKEQDKIDRYALLIMVCNISDAFLSPKSTAERLLLSN